jgi:thiol-disulfide isomerase/thioredoxin
MRVLNFGAVATLGIALSLLVLSGCKGRPASGPAPSAAGTPADTATARPPAHPFTRKHIYADTSAAQGDIAAGLKEARAQHKRVLLDFGGDWCGDCQVLDIYFHDPQNLPLLEQNFVLVHVNVGRIDQNLDIGEKYGVNLKKGVPALAVLSPTGQSLYGQSGQFSDMRYMQPDSVHAFLSRWKPS